VTQHNKTLTDPLDLLGLGDGDTLAAEGFGAITARAGVGKTALIIQIALNYTAQGKNLLHISLREPIAKVDVHYREVFDSQVQQYQLPNGEALWDKIVPHRFIMTFQVEGFSVPKLEERLTDLTTQDIFHPSMIIIDGLPFDEEVRPVLEALKTLAERANTPVWFTIITHRHEAPAPDGLPVQLSAVQDLFDVAIGMQPIEQVVKINVLKQSGTQESQSGLILDPATGLIRKNA
jgi:hypothetical protein